MYLIGTSAVSKGYGLSSWHPGSRSEPDGDRGRSMSGLPENVCTDFGKHFSTLTMSTQNILAYIEPYLVGLYKVSSAMIPRNAAVPFL